jgi:hypothetical protein
MIFVFTTLGDMNLREVFNECHQGKFAPLLIYEFEGQRILPFFVSADTCRKFCKRNLPKEWPSGQARLTQADLEVLAAENFQVRQFDWPRKIKGLVTWDVHVHEFVDALEITTDRHGLIR